MYNSDRFLALAEQYLKIQVKKESVDQVRDVVKLAEAERRSSPYETAGSTALKNMRDWLGEKLRDGPTLVNIQEIESKAPDWGLTPLDAALTFKDLRGDLWEGELITIEEHPAGYAAAWVERVH
jgi:hypothetical protein